jgi:hypothetical protein
MKCQSQQTHSNPEACASPSRPDNGTISSKQCTTEGICFLKLKRSTAKQLSLAPIASQARHRRKTKRPAEINQRGENCLGLNPAKEVSLPLRLNRGGVQIRVIRRHRRVVRQIEQPQFRRLAREAHTICQCPCATYAHSPGQCL